MTTDTIIKILLAAPFAGMLFYAIYLRLKLKKMGVKVSEGEKKYKLGPSNNAVDAFANPGDICSSGISRGLYDDDYPL